MRPARTIYRCWWVRICKTRLCLCLDFLRQIGHSNFGSTPHSKRLCRLRLCGLAYELPHRSHVYAPPTTGDSGVNDGIDLLLAANNWPNAVPTAAAAGNAVSIKIPDAKRCSSITAFRDDDATAAIIESLNWDAFADVVGAKFDDSSRRHVAGVSKRRSHGSSYSGDGDDSHEVCEVRKSHAEIDKLTLEIMA